MNINELINNYAAMKDRLDSIGRSLWHPKSKKEIRRITN